MSFQSLKFSVEHSVFISTLAMYCKYSHPYMKYPLIISTAQYPQLPVVPAV